jgi:RNA polymerase sigma-70 factor (ECF subfamily)
MFHNPESRNYGFNLLIRQYQQQVYWLIRRMVIDHDDTDDLVQETFIKVWKNLDSFRSDAKLYTWIFRIATNEALSFLNKKKRKMMIPLIHYDRVLAEKLTDGHDFTGDEIQKKLYKAMLTLPEKQRLVFQMKYFDEMKYEEMSEVLSTSVGALKASFHFAVKKIEEFIKLG